MSSEFELEYKSYQYSVNNCSQCGQDCSHVVREFKENRPILFLFDTASSMTSEAEELVDFLMASFGVSSNSYYFSSIVKCSNVPFDANTTKNCRRHLATEFRMLKSKAIVLLGSSSYEAFYGKRPSGNDVRGVINETKGFEIMTTCNPNNCQNNLKQKLFLYEDMGKLVSRLKELKLID